MCVVYEVTDFLIGIRPCFGFLRESPRSDRRSGRRNPSAGIGPAGGGVRRQGGAGLAVCGLPSGRRGRGKERKTDSPVRAVSAQAGESVSFRRGESTALRIAARDARETAVLVDERLLSAARALLLGFGAVDDILFQRSLHAVLPRVDRLAVKMQRLDERYHVVDGHPTVFV